MPDLTCLGCGKPFPTQKQLSAHSSRCSKNNALSLTSSAFDKKRRKSNKAGKRSKRTRIEREELVEQGLEAGLDYEAQMESADGTMFEQHENDAGPSNIPRSPSPPPPVTSKRSGRTVRMPSRFVDYLPGSATHLAHMPPTNRQQ
ncbi:hypothetical protein DEU56DRAFT_918678 [Suillus clintonianus]|uniref:uncharacterized protein n=1 Tax=Suillus clintonianus TaxID=1904413 RepID=UPI001B85D1FD|nr:uncharacterized protein DEU56DRAFT_918678 [Suillus clintonianus]KAG2119321.1 hypothetical protein DEU56DRAFT_918678 [Suillus clintonianus]